ncbi:MAG TPA: hypothetical protein VFE33_15200 [Thermoanaerobaculia bacterium]|nr:hypothetical protein [Thermoanaerobaculia bacterium]
MDQELRTYLDERFGTLDRKIDDRFETLDRKIDDLDRRVEARFDKVEGEIRLTQVSVEGVRGEVQLLAEGMIGLEEKMQALSKEVTLRLDQGEAALISYYRSLDRQYDDHNHRIRFLEERAQREGQAPLDYIRERYGKPKTAT